MTTAEIIEKLKADKKLENEEFSRSIYIDFKDHEIIDELGLGFQIVFRNCTFKKGFTFKNLTNSNCHSIYFDNCIFENDSFFSNINIGGINFYKCTFKNKFWLGQVAVSQLISFNEIKIFGKTDFKQCEGNLLEVTKCEFSSSTDFKQIKTINGEILITDCSLFGNINFLEIQSKALILSENFMGQCYISDLKTGILNLTNNIATIGTLRFENNIVAESIKIESDFKINFLKIGNIQNLSIIGNYKLIIIESKEFNFISIHGDFGIQKRKGKINNLFFKNRHFIGNLTISDYVIDNLTFSDLSSTSGIFAFKDLKIKKAFIHNIKVAKIHWDLVEFVDVLEIKTCDLSGLKPNNVTWLPNQVISPDNTKRKIPWLYRIRKKIHDDELITELKQQRDAYRQLKIASQNNHNQMEALAFYRNEMRLYWKEIRLVGGISKSNRILVFLNRWMSDFGQNYWLPLIWILIFQTIFSGLIWNFEACANCGVGTYCENDFWKGLSEYLTWINPIFKAPDDWSSGAKITSFFMRIFNGFFIYHFIKAIRKYGKGE